MELSFYLTNILSKFESECENLWNNKKIRSKLLDKIIMKLRSCNGFFIFGLL